MVLVSLRCRFATMMFGLPAACYAMYRAIPKQNRKRMVDFILVVA